MKSLFLFVLAASFVAAAKEGNLELGLNTISIPAPVSYTETTRGDDRFTFLWHSPSPQNNQLAVFVSEAELAKFGDGGEINSYCYVQQNKQVRGKFIFPADLKEIAAFYRKQGEANATIERGLREAQSHLSTLSGARFNVSEPTMLPMFYESRDVICMTLIGTLELTDGNATTKTPFATSFGMLVVRGNLITLYATDRQENMEKTRAVIREWLEQVFKANPPTVFEQGRYLFPGSSANGFDYWRIFVAGIQGAAFGLLVYGYSRWNKRRKIAAKAVYYGE